MKQKYQNDLGFIGICILLLMLPLLLIAQGPSPQHSFQNNTKVNLSDIESIKQVERATLQELFDANPQNKLTGKWNNLMTRLDCNVCDLKEVRCDEEGLIEMLQLADRNLDVIPASIHNLAKLKELHLEGNKLEKLPATLGNMSQLKELSIYDNEIKTLPEELRSLCGISIFLGLKGNPMKKEMTWKEFCQGI